MKKQVIDKDIELIYVEADSFPDGIMAAHQKLHSLVPGNSGRTYYGLSRPEGNGKIVYRAAVEALEANEAEKLGCKTFVLQKGTYSSIFIADFYNHVPAIGEAFQQLLDNPEIDPNGMCVEVYTNDSDVTCMVRLRD